MLYILWGLINVALAAFFIVICFNATKHLREKFGIVVAFFFVIMLLSFMANPKDDDGSQDSRSGQRRNWEFAADSLVLTYHKEHHSIKLEKTAISAITMGLTFAQDPQTQFYFPVSAYTGITGLEGGTKWKPSTIDVNKTDENGKFEYYVTGTVEWKLQWLTVYHQPKQYKGYVYVQ